MWNYFSSRANSGGTHCQEWLIDSSLFSLQVRLNDLCAIQKPHLFFLPDVPSVPFFPRDAHRHDVEVLEANYSVILAEFKAVSQRGIDSKLGWTSLGPKVHNKAPQAHHKWRDSANTLIYKSHRYLFHCEKKRMLVDNGVFKRVSRLKKQDPNAWLQSSGVSKKGL